MLLQDDNSPEKKITQTRSFIVIKGDWTIADLYQ